MGGREGGTLQAGVEFEEVEGLVLVGEKILHCAGIHIAHLKKGGREEGKGEEGLSRSVLHLMYVRDVPSVLPPSLPPSLHLSLPPSLPTSLASLTAARSISFQTAGGAATGGPSSIIF